MKQDFRLCGERLYRAWRDRRCVRPITEDVPNMTIEDAYSIQEYWVGLRVRRDGETPVGKKIGLTSAAVQRAFNVDQPDFGELTSAMRYEDDSSVLSEELIQPRAEGEIAFFLRRDLVGPGVSGADVRSATDYVSACVEVVDSRILDWKIRIQDTVADNASSGVFVLGSERVSAERMDFEQCRMSLEKNGEFAATGLGAATMGSPLTAVAWLANRLSLLGKGLHAGEVILSGALGPVVPVARGDVVRARVDGIGAVSLRFN